MTLEQKGYEINTRINAYLLSKGIKAPVIKYGIDPGTLSSDSRNSQTITYPYFQTFWSLSTEQPWTKEVSGVFTDFDYQLSYFAGPKDERLNDTKYFYPFNVVKNVLGDIEIDLLGSVASIRSKEGPYNFEMKSGMPVPSAVMIYHMRTVCSYEAIIPPPGETTDLSSAIQLTTT